MENNAHFQAAIFDMDGTLVDNMSFHTTALVEVAKNRFGVDLDPDHAEKEFGGRKNSEVFELIAGRPLGTAEAALCSDEKDERYRELYGPHMSPLRGARKLLERLRGAGVPIAIASAAPIGNRDFILDGLQLRPLFNAVVGQEDAARGKPAPDLFLVAAARLGVEPGACLVFEDAVNGILGARAAGMEVVGLTTVCDRAELRAAGARWSLADLEALPEDLERRLFG